MKSAPNRTRKEAHDRPLARRFARVRHERHGQPSSECALAAIATDEFRQRSPAQVADGPAVASRQREQPDEPRGDCRLGRTGAAGLALPRCMDRGSGSVAAASPHREQRSVAHVSNRSRAAFTDQRRCGSVARARPGAARGARLAARRVRRDPVAQRALVSGTALGLGLWLTVRAVGPVRSAGFDGGDQFEPARERHGFAVLVGEVTFDGVCFRLERKLEVELFGGHVRGVSFARAVAATGITLYRLP